MSCFCGALSGGPVEQSVVENTYRQIWKDIQQAGDIDGVFLMLHGATQSTEWDDCCGHFLERLRKDVGPNVTIAVAVDLHANVTSCMFHSADVICGYHRYPHVDTAQTGCRAARLGLRNIEEPLKKAGVRVPMIFAASAYTTETGPVHELMEYARQFAEYQGLLDYSVFQMQPWLDVSDAGATVLAYGDDEEKLRIFVRQVSDLELKLAGKIKPNEYSLSEVVREAEQNHTGRPYILCDAADSCNAGATGDNASVLAYVLQVQP